MSVSIIHSVNIQISGKTTFTNSSPVTSDAYDEIHLSVAADDSGTPGSLTVDVQPGPGNRIRFLLIQSSVYDPALTYTVLNQAGDDPDPVQMDAIQVFTGAGMLELLGADPHQLQFSNATAEEAEIVILVGRTAAVPPAP